MPLVSIIVPVYKVEGYLARCLDSVISQTFVEYECILVNDGSPDKCPTICDEYVKRDLRFKVIHKGKNEGLPMARKSGLDIALSDLIFHLDSDDWIEPHTLELLYRKQIETDAGVVIGNYNEISMLGIRPGLFTSIKKDECPLEWFLLCEHKFLWGKLYKRALYDEYIVPKTNIFEDAIVNVQLFARLAYDQVQFIAPFIYNYNTRMSTGSLITQLRVKKFDTYTEHPMIVSYRYIYDLLENIIHENDRIYSAYMYAFLNVVIICYFKGYYRIKKEEIYYFYVNYYKKCTHIFLMRKHRRFFLPLCNFSVIFGKIYILIYRIVLKLRNVFY